jgi:DNA-directed RNA polymerase II subunit RPB1
MFSIPTSIEKVQFYVLSESDMVTMKDGVVDNPLLFRDNIPVKNGIYDARLGTTDFAWSCETCKCSMHICPGHYGIIYLKTHIYSPLFLSNIFSILKAVCYYCGNKLPSSGKCLRCKKDQPTYSRTKITSLTFYIEMNKKKTEILPFQVYEIFSRISDETVESFGLPSGFHPMDLVPKVLLVPPNSIRPDAHNILSNKNNSNDITVLLQNVVSRNNALPTITEQTLTPEIKKGIELLNIAIYELQRGPYTALGQRKQYVGALMNRLPQKHGYIRRNILGKRSNNNGRSVIVNDVSLPIDHVSLPLLFAQSIRKPVTVQAYNFDESLLCVKNGVNAYPGCFKVKKKNMSYPIFINKFNTTHKLEFGDVIYRDLIDGDIINLNRQPSLEQSSITSVRARINNDHVIKFNVPLCSMFNADFDGDQMNAHVPQSAFVENEIQMCCGLDNSLISQKSATPKISHQLDSIVGLSELTHSDVVFTRYHVMNLFNNTGLTITLPDQDTFTGRDIITLYLTSMKFFINYTGKSSIGKSMFNHFYNFDPNDSDVKIVLGKHESGILDKPAIGEDVRGNIFQTIYGQYGCDQTLSAIYHLQQIALDYIIHYLGYTISSRDFYVNTHCKNEMELILNSQIDNSILITRHLHQGNIIAPIGQSLSNYYEYAQLNALEANDYSLNSLLAHIEYKNNLLKAIITSAKAKTFNLKNSLAYLGLIIVNGGRLQEEFSYGRASCYFPRFDEDPRSRGFITSSYAEGLNPVEYLYHKNDARASIAQKAIMTSRTGTLHRNTMKHQDAIIVDNHGYLSTERYIIQFLYGGNGFIQQYNEKDTVNLLNRKLTREQLENEFYVKLTKYGMKHNDEIQKELDKEFAKLLDVRKKYISRDEYLVSILPFHIGKIINFIGIQTTEPLDIKLALKSIDYFVENLPYIYSNSIQEQFKTELPRFYYDAINDMLPYIYSYLNIATLLRNKINNQTLAICITHIQYKLIRAVVNIGSPIGSRTTMCVIEPLTQRNLDSHHYAGAGVGTVEGGGDRIPEILTCKNTTRSPTANMTLYLIDEYAHDLLKVKLLALELESTKLENILSKYYIFAEEYRHPVHKDNIGDNKDLDAFEKLNKLTVHSRDLTNVCFKLYVNLFKMSLFNLTIEQVYFKLIEQFPQLYFVYTSLLHPTPYIKVYIPNDNSLLTLNNFKTLLTQILNATIKGIEPISQVFIKEDVEYKLNDDGTITEIPFYYMKTLGTNFEKILNVPQIDKYKSYTTSLTETYKFLGIVGVRRLIFYELKNSLEELDEKHFSIYADVITITGEPTSLDRYGAKSRKESILNQASDSSPINVFVNAAIHKLSDAVNRSSSAIMLTQVPKMGTNFNYFVIDESKFKTKEKSIIDEI